jgi:hypothetical protein
MNLYKCNLTISILYLEVYSIATCDTETLAVTNMTETSYYMLGCMTFNRSVFPNDLQHLKYKMNNHHLESEADQEVEGGI